MRGSKICWSLCVLLGAFLRVQSTAAQTNAEVNAGIQFNFSTPGAKSLGLGSAFVGLANDATAAYANPAGLTALASPEISIEGRRTDYTHLFTDKGREEGVPTGLGVDTIAGLVQGEADNSVNGLSYVSYVYPGNGWAVAVYRHELANFEATFSAGGAFLNDPSRPRLLPSRNEMALRIDNIGASAAYSFGGGLSVGLGVSAYQFDFQSRTERFNVLASGDPAAPGGLFGPPDFSPGNVLNVQTQEGDDTDVGLTAGLVWEANDRLRFGTVFRQGPEAEIRARSERTSGQALVDRTASFKVPDVLAFGLAVNAAENLILTFDYAYVQYSQLADELEDIFGVPGFEVELGRFEAADAHEIRVGAEYSFRSLALRLGSWYDPDHRIRFAGSEASLRALFQEGEDNFHYTAGFGYRLGKRLEVNAAFDYSERVRTGSLSLAGSLPRRSAVP